MRAAPADLAAVRRAATVARSPCSNGGAVGGGEDGEVAVRVIAGVDAAAHVFAEAERFGGCLADPIVQLAGADVAVYAFRGGAEAGQFVIVDGAGAVHGDVVDEAALQQIDDVAVDAGTQDVRAHHEDTCRAGRFGTGQARGDGGQIGVLKRGGGVAEREPAVQVQIVLALGQRLDQQARAVELFISAHGWQIASAGVPGGSDSWG